MRHQKHGLIRCMKIPIFLLVVMIVNLLVACSGSDNTGDNTTIYQNTTEPKIQIVINKENDTVVTWSETINVLNCSGEKMKTHTVSCTYIDSKTINMENRGTISIEGSIEVFGASIKAGQEISEAHTHSWNTQEGGSQTMNLEAPPHTNVEYVIEHTKTRAAGELIVTYGEEKEILPYSFTYGIGLREKERHVTNCTDNETVDSYYILETDASPDTAGVVKMSPDGGNYKKGTSIIITAEPDSEHVFVGWSGDASGEQNPLSITLDSNKHILANFSVPEYSVSTQVSPKESGTITGAGTFEKGDSTNLVAVPNPGYAFFGWSGHASGTQNPLSVDIDSDKTIIANFVECKWNLITMTSPIEGGSVTGGGPYQDGEYANIHAIAGNDYQFVSWAGDITGTQNPVTIKMDEDKTILASFQEKKPVADFSFTVTNDTLPMTVQFQSKSEGIINTYSWDFGDSCTSNLQNPSHEFSSPGQYSVTLTVVGPGGMDTYTKNNIITVSGTIPDSWSLVNSTTNLYHSSHRTGFEYNNQLYSIESSNAATQYERASVNSNGDLNAWELKSLVKSDTMDSSVYGVSVTLDTHSSNPYVYISGGFVGYDTAQTTVASSKIQEDGTLGNWRAEHPMIIGRDSHSLIVCNGYLYAVGGTSSSGGFLNSVEFAKIGENGVLGPWTLTSSMVETRPDAGVIQIGDYLYAMGGGRHGQRSKTIERALINQDGTLGPWQIYAQLNDYRTNFAIVKTQTHVYIYGGHTGTYGTGATNTVERALISGNDLGTFSYWKDENSNFMMNPRNGVVGLEINGVIYAIGGSNGSETFRTVEYVQP